MPLKNYTSQVAASRSVAWIEQQLVKHGAKQILKQYDDGILSGICFMINIDGQEMPFKLPAKVRECQLVLEQNLGRRARPETRKKLREQAERTAWKILFDWVGSQMAMIELAQVELMEIFLPYLYDAAKDLTYFQMVKEKSYKGLLPSFKG